MGERGKWMEKITRQMELSPEPVPGLPLVEISGQRRVLIENHRGVSGYGREQICIRVNYGEISVRGCGLELARMSREQLVITGRIDCVSLIRREKR